MMSLMQKALLEIQCLKIPLPLLFKVRHTHYQIKKRKLSSLRCRNHRVVVSTKEGTIYTYMTQTQVRRATLLTFR